MAVDNNMLRYVTLQCLTLRHITAPTAQDNSAGKMMTVDEREKRRKKGRRRVTTSHRPWAKPKLLGRPRTSTYLDPTNAKGNGDCSDNSRAAKNTVKKYNRRKYRCRPI